MSESVSQGANSLLLLGWWEDPSFPSCHLINTTGNVCCRNATRQLHWEQINRQWQISNFRQNQSELTLFPRKTETHSFNDFLSIHKAPYPSPRQPIQTSWNRSIWSFRTGLGTSPSLLPLYYDRRISTQDGSQLLSWTRMLHPFTYGKQMN